MKFVKEANKLYSKLEAEDVDGKIILYRKREVFPILNQDGSVNWRNFILGKGVASLLITLFVILIICGTLWEYSSNLKAGAECMSNYNLNISQASQPNINWSAGYYGNAKQNPNPINFTYE